MIDYLTASNALEDLLGEAVTGSIVGRFFASYRRIWIGSFQNQEQ
ncbi:hypothetical protein BCh11DRAFT_02961 [Burkholderia sp. Ch1-1]|nr:hypothetical protein BCh11DRAFT_02961 [Burkholderia sp. Ch1-1]